jgi:NaMN:DMB phosphoribosyltransferase
MGLQKERKRMKKMILLAGVAAIAAACNVTRVITNESQYLQKGDTSIVIQTKTIETYDASKKML